MPPGYGYPVLMPYPAPPANNGMSVAGFVTGLCGLVLFWIPLVGVILAATGVALSGVGMAQAKKLGRPAGLGVAGLVLGILGVLAFFVLMLAVVAG